MDDVEVHQHEFPVDDTTAFAVCQEKPGSAATLMVTTGSDVVLLTGTAAAVRRLAVGLFQMIGAQGI